MAKKAKGPAVYEIATSQAAALGLKVYCNHGVTPGGVLVVTDKKKAGTPRGVYINPDDCPAEKQQEHQA